MKRPSLLTSCVLTLTAGIFALLHAAPRDVRFVILGDRTGEAQPGVYEEIWRETAAEHPDFVINVGDTIQGDNDATVNAEWTAVKHMLQPFSRYRFFYTPGNHDVWDETSATAYVRYTGHPLHYGFDFADVHISVLDNSRTEDLSTAELDWLEQDLAEHKQQPVKFIFSHRPSWILYTLLQNPHFRLQELAEKYGVKYVIAGHIHEMLHFDVNGVMYLSVASSGGHLRNSKQYRDGWFFAHTLVTVHDGTAQFEIKEAQPPHGEGRVSKPDDWGAAGLLKH